MGIDRAGPDYIYRQLADDLRRQIRGGQIPPRQKLPTVAELMDVYGVASMTVRKALAVLAAEGMVTTYPGRGTFVS